MSRRLKVTTTLRYTILQFHGRKINQMTILTDRWATSCCELVISEAHTCTVARGRRHLVASDDARK